MLPLRAVLSFSATLLGLLGAHKVSAFDGAQKDTGQAGIIAPTATLANYNNITTGIYSIRAVTTDDSYNCLTANTDGRTLSVLPCVGNFGDDSQSFAIVLNNDGQYFQIQSYKFGTKTDGQSCITGDRQADQKNAYLGQCYTQNIKLGAASSTWTLPAGKVDLPNNHLLRFMVGSESTNFLSYANGTVGVMAGTSDSSDTTMSTYWVVAPVFRWW